MPYVKRDAEGRIAAVAKTPADGYSEVACGAPELQTFMREMGMEPNSLAESDMRLVRVLEDLIDLLISRDLIRFTDLPRPAQEKLLERRSLRQSMGALDLLGSGDEII